MKIAQGKCLYDGSSDVENFLFGVGKNTLLKELRKQSREKQLVSMRIAEDVQLEDVLGETKTDKLEFAEYRDVLKDIIARLPDKTRYVMKLVYIDGYSASEAAVIIDCEHKTIRKRLHYGLVILKKDLTLKKYRDLLDKCLVFLNFF